MGEVYLNKKPVVEEYEYAYVETADGSITRVPRSKIYPYVPASKEEIEELNEKIVQETGNLSSEIEEVTNRNNAISNALTAEKERAVTRENEIEELFTMPTQEAVDKWLDEHPEATTTVQDGSLGTEKFTDDAKLFVMKDYVTPEMFGAVGDGVADDTVAFQSAVDSGKYVYIPVGCYRITSPITVNATQLILVGQNAPYLQGGFGTGDVNVLKKTYSCIFADFESDGTLLTIPKTCYRSSIRNICFLSNKYEMTFNNNTYETTENIAIETVNGVNAESKADISKCGFYGFSGYAIFINAQHSRLTNCAFQENNDVIKISSYDNRFSGLWISNFRRGIYDTDSTRGKIELNNCWFDQGLGHCMEFSTLPYIVFNDVWIDLIGGSAIYCESTSGNMSGIFIGRINRTNVLEPFADYASIEVGRILGLVAIIDSTQTHPNGNNSVELIHASNRFLGNVIISPNRENVVSSTNYNRNYIVNSKCSYISWGGSYQFYNGGTQVRPSFSDTYAPPSIGSLQFNTNTQSLYVCTSLDPVTWMEVKSSKSE